MVRRPASTCPLGPACGERRDERGRGVPLDEEGWGAISAKDASRRSIARAMNWEGVCPAHEPELDVRLRRERRFRVLEELPMLPGAQDGDRDGASPERRDDRAELDGFRPGTVGDCNG